MIKLHEGYFIDTDRWNVMLKREVPAGKNPFGTETKNTTRVIDIGYHVNLANALNQYLDERIKDKIASEDISVAEMKDFVETVRDEILEAAA